MIQSGWDPSQVDDAAQIWAEATAARDDEPQVPGLDVARPVIQRVLHRSPRALLLTERTADGTAAGFVIAEPLAGADIAGADNARAQVSYLGVLPAQWGHGVGERLLLAAQAQLAAEGFSHAELSVYVDNSRAAALYERLGWLPRGSPTPHPRTGKPEQRYELRL